MHRCRLCLGVLLVGLWGWTPASSLKPHRHSPALRGTSGHVFELNTTIPRQCLQPDGILICTLGRNVGWAVNEWLVYHLWSAGANHVAFYDHNSTDNTRAVLGPWVKAGVVTLHSAGLQNSSESTFGDCWQRYHLNYTWVTYIDVDEWLLSLRTPCLHDVLHNRTNISSLTTQRYSVTGLRRFARRDRFTVFEAANYSLGHAQPLVRPICHSQNALGPMVNVPYCCSAKPGFPRVDESMVVNTHSTDLPCWMPSQWPSEHLATDIMTLHTRVLSFEEHLRCGSASSDNASLLSLAQPEAYKQYYARVAANHNLSTKASGALLTRMQSFRELLNSVLIGRAKLSGRSRDPQTTLAIDLYDMQPQAHWVNPDPLRWNGGFYSLDIAPQRAEAADDAKKYLTMQGSCSDIARFTPEPLSPYFARRHRPPRALEGGGHRAYFRWEGNITREAFDRTHAELRHGDKCIRCGAQLPVKYQIRGGHLYRHDNMSQFWTQTANEAMILFALYLFDLPDMDFMLYLGDGCPPNNSPLVGWSICRNFPQAGFTFPSYSAWMMAYGPTQMQVYHNCLNARYPEGSKQNKVFWRGSSTDAEYNWYHNISYVDKVTRLKVHKLFVNDTLIDAKLVFLLDAPPEVKEYITKLQPLGDRVPLEDNNKAAVVMDFDGNGWSDRLTMMVHFPTVIFKQASNQTAFFEHLLVPGQEVEYMEHDISDLKERAYQLIDEWKTKPERLISNIRRRQALASKMMNIVAVAEAAAYSLLQYKLHTSWEFVPDRNYTYVSFREACHHQMHIPRELCERLAQIPQPEEGSTP